MRRYRNDILPIRESKMVESNCNQITFVNRGAANAQLNGYPLNAGEQVSFEGLECEQDTTIYQVTFTSSGEKLVFAIRKLYT